MPDHKEYQKQRNALIPHAERYANKIYGKEPEGSRIKWVRNWNMVFLERMDELVREINLWK